MQLTSHDQAYPTLNNQIEIFATGHTASFRGQSYTLRRPAKTFKAQLNRSKKTSRFCLWCLVKNNLHISKSKTY